MMSYAGHVTGSMQAVVDRYFEAWESQNPALLDDVFTQNAAYVVRPFGMERYDGLAAIKDYWHRHPVSTHIQPKTVVISQAFDENSCFVEWETVFQTPANTRKTVRGMLRLEFENGLVKELREHYASQEA